ncbi:MAG: Na+/H+ antiporter NhaC family protein [Eggerthellaceae bacterium]|nr:Na+/H+ antiporter NhaC family protein [Eggerthellaceae bacterium]
MEGFELISTGAWSIVPPLLALGLALLTKEVYSSLLVGVFSGLIIYEFCLEGAGVQQLITAFTLIPQVMAEQIASNAALILFLALLGALVVVVAVAGGSRAYAEWAAKHIKSARMATVMTAVLGIVVFVDDYFNCLTVGAVMRPVTDKFRISHEKLAWIIDSTAAPVCIIAPVSSWAVAMGGYMGEDGFNIFCASIPYNLYALITIVFVFAMCGFGKDFFSMGKAQRDCDAHQYSAIPEHPSALEAVAKAGVPKDPDAIETVVTEQSDLEGAGKAIEQFKGLDVSPNGKVYDLIIPILVLIVFSITGMLYVGGFFEGVDFATAVGEDPISGLCIGAAVALVVAACMFLPRKLTTLAGFTEGASEGVRSMVGAIMILVLAWSLGGACRYMLGTGEFVATTLTSIGFQLSLLPAVIFVVSGFIGFAMGTSWGTAALILPIVLGIFPEGDPLFLVTIGATLAGAVYGDHISPISDTTILSSAGAECNHLRHVATQIPYATIVAAVCLVGYLVSGFTGSPWPSLIGGIVVILAVVVATRIRGSKQAA